MNTTYEEAVLQIKDRIDILEIISEEVVLKKSGSNYWGLCPFHGEKTPSFSVNPSRGFFKCFGCGVGGDAISFLMQLRNWDFNQTIQYLADKYNIELPQKTFNGESTKDVKNELIKACEKAVEFYSSTLLNESMTSLSRKYLSARDINEDIIKEYSLGLALKEPNALYKVLKKDFSDETLEKAGLALKNSQGKYIDRFRNRIIIPIQNEQGEYVAFGARAVEDGQNPKYLNSSDSPIYNKGRLLYGLYKAKDAIKTEDSVIIMEGYFDVISTQAHGIKNCVASCGTSMTLEHVKLLSKYTKSRRIFLSFDTDMAGQNATRRGGELIKTAFQGLGNIKQFDESHISSSEDKYACEIRVVSPPEGKDPDEFIRNSGADAFLEHINNAPLLLDFQLNELLKKKSEIHTPLDKSKLVAEIVQLLDEIQNKIVQSEYIKIVSTALDIDEQVLSKEVQSTLNQDFARINVDNRTMKSSSIEEKIQKNILSLYLINSSPFTFSELSDKIKNVNFTNETLIIVKSTIDKLIKTVNNVSELINNLYLEFSGNIELTELITNLICISEPFNNLDVADFESVIAENIEKLVQCKRLEEVKALKEQYVTVNEDETEALRVQLQLQERIKNFNQTGEE